MLYVTTKGSLTMIIIKEAAIILLAMPVLVAPALSQDIHEAAWNGDFEKVKLLLDEDPQLVNTKGPWGWTPLQRAVYFNHMDIVKFMISKGADLDLTTPNGETALHWAIKLGHTKLSKFLIANNANADIKDKWGLTPLQIAVENGYVEIVKILIERGVELNRKESHYGRTLLHLASINGHLDIVKILLDHGMDVDAIDNNGKNSLDYAFQYCNKRIAQILKARGTNKDDRTKFSCSSDHLKKELERNEAIVWYLGSCGWAIKTENHLLIFDYWEYGRRPAEPSLSNGHIHPDEIKDLNVYVFVTHAHIDHYDPVIFEWDKSVNKIKYIFGWKAKEVPGYTYLVGPRAIETVDDLEIYTINSHHVDVPEVAYLVKVDELSIYFNGDYKGEIRKDIDYLSTKSDHVDLAFAEGEASVTTYMLERLTPIVWFPMHERGTEFKYKRYPQKVVETNLKTKVMCAENRGDRFIFDKNGIRQLF